MANTDFLSVADDFQLGILDTERPHPLTSELSELANGDLRKAFQLLREVDSQALTILQSRIDDLKPLAAAIRKTLDRDHKVFLCGCGATGRLSISLEVFARSGLLRGANDKNIVGFMAGGDAALIRSIESFEDRPDYGARQLVDLGFSDGDLLISSTEGGETPFVIGATEKAAEVSSEKPFFLYCNPDDVLCANVERSRKVIESDDIRKINLAVGPMALSGSTRMQASTVLMAAIGFAMKHSDNPENIAPDFARWRSWVFSEINWETFVPFTRAESEAYLDSEYVIYEPGEYGLTVLTDTTERSPTFTLTPFERAGYREAPSLSYVWIDGASSARESWEMLLRRRPNSVDWGTRQHLTSRRAIQSFDFSNLGRNLRIQRTGGSNHEFVISRSREGIHLIFQNEIDTIPVPGDIDFFGENLALKMLLNAHSTLIMGKLGRYEGNLMTYVSATNFKLIDRAIRYVRLLLEKHHHLDIPYRNVAKILLKEKENLREGEPVVLKTVETILRNKRKKTLPKIPSDLAC